MIFQTYLVAAGANSLREALKLLWTIRIPWGWTYTAGTVADKAVDMVVDIESDIESDIDFDTDFQPDYIVDKSAVVARKDLYPLQLLYLAEQSGYILHLPVFRKL